MNQPPAQRTRIHPGLRSPWLSALCVLVLPTLARSATIDIYVHNVNGSTVSGARVTLYRGATWQYQGVRTTDGSGKARFAALDYDDYHYEVEYNGTGTFEYWGYEQNIPLYEPLITRHFTRNWPYLYDSDLPPDPYVDESVEIDIEVKNNLTFSRSVKVELWVDRNQSSSWDFHDTSSSQTVSGNGGRKTFTFTITPSVAGTYYWRAHVKTFNDGAGTYIVTDTTSWQEAFDADEQTATVDVYVENIGGNDVQGARVYMNNDTETTNSSGRARFYDVPFGHHTFEVYYNGTGTDEFWGDSSIDVDGPTETTTFRRNWPYLYDSDLPPDPYVDESVEIDIEVKNNLTFSRSVKVELWVDRNQSSSWDFHDTSSSQTVSGNGGRKTFTFTITPSVAGTYYWRAHVKTFNDGAGTYIVTDTTSWQEAFDADQRTGDLEVTVKNVHGSPVEGARVVRYDPGGGSTVAHTDPNGSVLWHGLAIGDYHLEAYYTGTVFGEEYWGDVDATVEPDTLTHAELNRIYPWGTSIVLRNQATGLEIEPTDLLVTGVTVQIEVTIRNNVSQGLAVTVRPVLDIDESEPYLYSGSATEFLPAHSERPFIFSHSPENSGTWLRALQVETELLNGSVVLTDAWPWEQAFLFQHIDAGLADLSFDKRVYKRGDLVAVAYEVINRGDSALQNVYLVPVFIGPDGSELVGIASPSFTVEDGTVHDTGLVPALQTTISFLRGAYTPKVELHGSDGHVLAVFERSDADTLLSPLPLGEFPRLGSLVVRSQEHFDADDPMSVARVLDDLTGSGVSSFAMSVKLDDGAGLWSGLNPLPGQVLFDTSNASPSAQNPITYDIYAEAQAACGAIGCELMPWVPTFFDHAALADHPTWELPDDPLQQGFVDGSLSVVRDYEATLIEDSLGDPYETPNRLYIDHFRYTHGQHGPEGITALVALVDQILPDTAQLAGYIWLPSDTWWSGQDYAQLSPYLDVFSPMLYWQDSRINSSDDIATRARVITLDWVAEITAEMGSGFVADRVSPVMSITTSVDYADGGSGNLDAVAWQRAQFNVLGALADRGIAEYDLFYHGNWLWLVYPEAPAEGQWIDWACRLAGLALDCISDQECHDGDVCNGAEVCADGQCEPGVPLDCDDGEFCNGSETCDSELGCQPGSDPCPGQLCDEVGNRCVDCLVHDDCDDGIGCTANTCNDTTGECEYPVESGFCLIDGTCHSDGATRPGSECEGCRPSENATGWSPLPEGTGCGDPTDTVCDNPDTCDGQGTCQTNPEPTTTICQADAGDCDVPEYCDGTGTCPEDAFEPVGTPCGDPTDDACTDPDTCDGEGTCLDNNEPDGTSCIDELFCNGMEICSSGTCVDGPDPCPGVCNEENDSCPCVQDSDCAEDELTCTTARCNQASGWCEWPVDSGYCLIDGLCYADGDASLDNDCLVCSSSTSVDAWTPALIGTACGDDSDTICTDPDTCDGSGICLPNHAPDGTSCEDDLFCNGAEACTGGTCESPGDPCDSGWVCNEDSDVCECDDAGDCNDDDSCTTDSCVDGDCVHTPIPNCPPCVPNCAGRECGSDGCGGSCGTCTPPDTCNTTTGQCETICVPDCTGRECGDDGCGSSCGTCTAPATCNTTTGQCETCLPDCTGRQCGDDGCGGSCGTCPDDGLFCTGDPVCSNGTCGFTGSTCAGDTPVCCENSDSCVAECCSDTDCPDEDEECLNGECETLWELELSVNPSSPAFGFELPATLHVDGSVVHVFVAESGVACDDLCPQESCDGRCVPAPSPEDCPSPCVFRDWSDPVEEDRKHDNPLEVSMDSSKAYTANFQTVECIDDSDCGDGESCTDGVCVGAPCIPNPGMCGACGDGACVGMIMALFGWFGLRFVGPGRRARGRS